MANFHVDDFTHGWSRPEVIGQLEFSLEHPLGLDVGKEIIYEDFHSVDETRPGQWTIQGRDITDENSRSGVIHQINILLGELYEFCPMEKVEDIVMGLMAEETEDVFVNLKTSVDLNAANGLNYYYYYGLKTQMHGLRKICTLDEAEEVLFGLLARRRLLQERIQEELANQRTG